jgi:hypothetical protein
MQNHGVSYAAFLAAALVFAYDDCWAFDPEQEQKSLALVSFQVDVACGASGRSSSRIQISSGVLQRIDAHMAYLSDEIHAQSRVLDHYNLSQNAVADGFAKLDDAISAAQADVKSKQWEYDTATMYKTYSASNVKKSKLALGLSRAHLAELRALKTDGSRSPASAAAAAAGQTQVAEATSSLSALAGLTDRYEFLRNQTFHCMKEAGGNQDGEKAASIDAGQNFDTSATGGASQGAPAVPASARANP